MLDIAIPFRLPALAVLVLALGLVAGGCTSQVSIDDTSVPVIGLPEVRAMVGDRDSGAVLVDVRPRRFFEEQHIPGAVSIPMSEMQAGDPRLQAARRIVVYSASGSDRLSLAGAKKLLTLGYSNVSDFRGGLNQWVAAGNPVVVGPRQSNE